ncbi:MAG: hypothetical protein JNM07_09680 [Phycisphaerae bacterium]|nr:hypothetical protein [Phycisphaerae bacterium]
MIPRREHRPARRRGFSLVEAAISVVLVGGVVVASLGGISAALRSARAASDRARASQLAGDLMTEILSCPVDDPLLPSGVTDAPPTTVDRRSCNDIDDYAALADTPPKDRDGTPISGYTSWSRRVTVQWVLAATPETPSNADTGLRRITVTVWRNGTELARLVGLRSRSWQLPPYTP